MYEQLQTSSSHLCMHYIENINSGLESTAGFCSKFLVDVTLQPLSDSSYRSRFPSDRPNLLHCSDVVLHTRSTVALSRPLVSIGLSLLNALSPSICSPIPAILLPHILCFSNCLLLFLCLYVL